MPELEDRQRPENLKAGGVCKQALTYRFPSLVIEADQIELAISMKRHEKTGRHTLAWYKSIQN